MLKKLLIVSLSLTLLTDLFLYKALNKVDDLSLRKGLSPSIFYIVNNAETGGGTGFQLKDSHGHEHLLTNSHVCKHTMNPDRTIKVKNNEGLTLKLRVVDFSEEVDVCVIEPVPNAPALELGRKWEVGEKVHVLGHPFLFPGVFVTGEISYPDDVQIGKFLVTPDNEAECNGKNERIAEINSLFGPMRICVATFNAVTTTCQIHPGNSGSPLLNEYGKVIGIMFAGNNDTNWGSAIPLEDLRKYINTY